MLSKIGSFHVLLLEGILHKNNIRAIINKSMDLFKGKEGFLQCCSIEFIPSLKFAVFSMENAIEGRIIGKTRVKKKFLNFLLWLYCTNQLDRAIGLAGKWEKGVLLAIASKYKKDLEIALALAKRLGFREKKGLIEGNFRANPNSFIERFGISKKELKALSPMKKQEAVEKLIIERQALLSL